MGFLSNKLFDVKFQYCSVVHHWLKLEELVYFAGLSNRFDPLPCRKLLFCTCSLYKDLLRTNMKKRPFNYKDIPYNIYAELSNKVSLYKMLPE